MARLIKRLWCTVIGFHTGLHIGSTCTTCGTTFNRRAEREAA